MLKRHRQLQVKDLPKVPTWRLERDSNLRPSGRKATNLPMSHHVPQTLLSFIRLLKKTGSQFSYLNTNKLHASMPWVPFCHFAESFLLRPSLTPLVQWTGPPSTLYSNKSCCNPCRGSAGGCSYDLWCPWV